MRTDDLAILDAIVQYGSVTKAARFLHRVPSGLTARIKELEKEVGKPLFTKEGRALVLTEAGTVTLNTLVRCWLLNERWSMWSQEAGATASIAASRQPQSTAAVDCTDLGASATSLSQRAALLGGEQYQAHPTDGPAR